MTAGSGLLMPRLDELIARAGRRPGVLAVLDAADRLHADTRSAEAVRDDR